MEKEIAINKGTLSLEKWFPLCYGDKNADKTIE